MKTKYYYLLLITIMIITISNVYGYKINGDYTINQFKNANLSKINLEPSDYEIIDDNNVKWTMKSLNKSSNTTYSTIIKEYKTFIDDKTIEKCENSTNSNICLNRIIKNRQKDFETREVRLLKKQQEKEKLTQQVRVKKSLLNTLQTYLNDLISINFGKVGMINTGMELNQETIYSNDLQN